MNKTNEENPSLVLQAFKETLASVMCDYPVPGVFQAWAGVGLQLTRQHCQSRWARWIKVYIWVISHLGKPWTILLLVFGSVFGMCVCVCVFKCWIWAMPCQPSLLHLSFIPLLSALHFHVYRLGLLVCILTISVWKPADSPALWAPQGHRFIGEGGSYSLHQFSWSKFAIFLFGYVAMRQMYGHSDSAGVFIPAS